MPESRVAVAAVHEPGVAAAPTWGASGKAIGEPGPKNAKPDVGSFDQHLYD